MLGGGTFFTKRTLVTSITPASKKMILVSKSFNLIKEASR